MEEISRINQILLVEDNYIFTYHILSAITKLPGKWECKHFVDGSSALEAIDRRGFYADIALIDLGLPDISGLEIIRALRARSPNIPILVVSINISERAVISAIREGARGYLHKDETVAKIQNSILEVLNGNNPISPSLARYLFKLAGHPSQASGLNPYHLTNRELDVLRLIATGMKYAEVANQLGISISTVQSHIKALYAKLEATSQVQAINKARAGGIL